MLFLWKVISVEAISVVSEGSLENSSQLACPGGSKGVVSSVAVSLSAVLMQVEVDLVAERHLGSVCKDFSLVLNFLHVGGLDSVCVAHSIITGGVRISHR